MHLCYGQCVGSIFYGTCSIPIVNMTTDGGARLRKAFEAAQQVRIGKMIVSISPSGPFLQRFTSFVDSVSYLNYREATFQVPDGNTISEFSIWSAPEMRAFIAGSNTHIESLEISQCSLDRMPQTLPKMTKMKNLSIRQCKLTVVRLDMFADNQILKILDLSYNQIRQLLPATERPARMLSIETLALSGNLLQHLDMTDFKSMPQLLKLHVGGNLIVSINALLPITMKNLIEFWLESNKITALDLRNLTLPKLDSLGLDANALTRLPFLPRSLPKLNSLSLMSNNLTQLDLSYFRPYPNLNKIDISYNQITSVRTSSPVRLSVSTLDLRYNQITTFNLTGCDTPNITLLLLGQNRLTVFPPVYEKYPNIRLSINWNFFFCDTLLYYKEKIQKYDLMVEPEPDSPTCGKTYSLQVKQIQECCGK
uniref:Uncharacterized protein n=2 Tax=Anopheles gambiae TaxID=7165 RepID=A0A1S4GV71_ANOGA